MKQRYVTGFDPAILRKTLKWFPTYLKTLRRYQKMNPLPSLRFRFSDAFPILTDLESDAGVAGGHYFHQDLWAAKKIFARQPAQHFDIGSRIDGFIAHLLVFMPVIVIDIRPMVSEIAGLTFLQDDAAVLEQIPDSSLQSLSSLHVAEHFGLGRYTDPIDPAACFQFMGSLQRVLAPGGTLLFSVPIGRERVEFNAHRVFSPQTILDHFQELQLISFSFVGDDGKLYEQRDLSTFPESEMACGLFEFTRAATQ